MWRAGDTDTPVSGIIPVNWSYVWDGTYWLFTDNDGVCNTFRMMRFEDGATHIKEKFLSAIHLCERCGALVKGDALAFVTYQPNIMEQAMRMDLCPDCIQEAIKYLSETTEPKERSYSKPFRTPSPESETLDEAVRALRTIMGSESIKALEKEKSE